MRRLIAVLMLLWAADAHAIIIIGGTGAPPDPPPPTCSTQSYDVQSNTYNTYSVFASGEQRGQSWTAGSNGVLYSLYVHRNTIDSDATNITIRMGTGTNLSGTCSAANTCKVSFTCAISDSVGWKECVIPEGNRPTLSSSTVYYFIMQITSGSAYFYISRDSAGGYADGTAYYEAYGTNWDVTGHTSSSDYAFRTKMCD